MCRPSYSKPLTEQKLTLISQTHRGRRPSRVSPYPTTPFLYRWQRSRQQAHVSHMDGKMRYQSSYSRQTRDEDLQRSSRRATMPQSGDIRQFWLRGSSVEGEQSHDRGRLCSIYCSKTCTDKVVQMCMWVSKTQEPSPYLSQQS